MAVAAGKLAVRELFRLAGVVLERLDTAVLRPEHPAWGDFAAAWAEPLDAAAALALYKPDAARFAA
jgi:hypothetical protein